MYAHSPNTAGQWHRLEEHLRGTAARAEAFARALGAPEAGRLLGLWHDLGKFNPEWQEYLRRAHAGQAARGHGPPHASTGALLAMRHLGPLAMLIQAHHAGLVSPEHLRQQAAAWQKDPAIETALTAARAALAELEPAARPPLPAHVNSNPLSAELFLRLLFSALIDADRLDTAAHGHAETEAMRGADADMQELWRRLEAAQRQYDTAPDSTVNRVRREVYEACLAAADGPTGLYRLTVPTGGGKTRSGMAFALRHAIRHGLRRVIIAVPYLTITQQTAGTLRSVFERGTTTEQTAAELRGILGERAVLEHHSGVTVHPAAEEGFRGEDVWSRLSAENWDAPVIVTTTVQLFESLFSSRPSAVRKLHRLAGSVIILDEAQALPVHLLTPILNVLGELTAHYKTTVVLSTATQPAFAAIPAFRDVPAQEIVPQPERHFAALKRVTYDWRTERPRSWPEVAELMRSERQALAVLNTKADALALLDALDDPQALHLSTLLCGAHRQQVVAEVKTRLAAGEPCRLISTQVVEAGVDLDFPLVLRALGPLDSIIQAAGRCNREGRLAAGRMIVFEPAEGRRLPGGAYGAGADITRAITGDGLLDPDHPEAPARYFRLLYGTVSTDRERIQDSRAALDYAETARRFRMIDDHTESVIVTRYGTDAQRDAAHRLVDQLRGQAGNARELLRQAQPYLVSLRAWAAERYRRETLIEELLPGVGAWHGEYDQVRGLTAAGQSLAEYVI